MIDSPGHSRQLDLSGAASLAAKLAAPIIIIAAAAAFLFSAPTQGDFWWFDAPSHAMNGAFIHDFIAAAPFGNPMGWAIKYYLQYPAISIGLYPPLFPAAEALMFSLFGVSHFAAQATVSVFAGLLALAIYNLARMRLPPVAAIGAAVMFLGLPGVAFWGRQVMLEVPAMCLAAWSMFFLIRYIERGRALALYGSVFALILALYTKQTFAFLVPAFVLSLIWGCSWRVALRRELWITAFGSVILLLPLAALTLKFGMMNANLATGVDSTAPSRFSLQSLLWYGADLPNAAGWPVLILAIVFVALWSVMKGRRHDPLIAVLLTSFLTGYLFFTMIALKDGRYTLHLLIPLGIMAALAVHEIAPRRWGAPLTAALGAGLFLFTLATQTVPRVDGFREAADLVTAHAPRDSTVLFYGQRSAAFVFDLRARGSRPDLRVLRAEKLFVHYRQGRAGGVKDLGADAAAIEAIFPRYRIAYAVYDPQFWDDLPSIQAMDRVLSGPRFTALKTITVEANVAHNDHEIRIARYDGILPERAEPLRMDMPLINGQFSESGR